MILLEWNASTKFLIYKSYEYYKNKEQRLNKDKRIEFKTK